MTSDVKILRIHVEIHMSRHQPAGAEIGSFFSNPKESPSHLIPGTNGTDLEAVMKPTKTPFMFQQQQQQPFAITKISFLVPPYVVMGFGGVGVGCLPP